MALRPGARCAHCPRRGRPRAAAGAHAAGHRAIRDGRPARRPAPARDGIRPGVITCTACSQAKFSGREAGVRVDARRNAANSSTRARFTTSATCGSFSSRTGRAPSVTRHATCAPSISCTATPSGRRTSSSWRSGVPTSCASTPAPASCWRWRRAPTTRPSRLPGRPSSRSSRWRSWRTKRSSLSGSGR